MATSSGAKPRSLLQDTFDHQTKFRYTQDQRRKETKAKKYRDYLQERKQETVDGKRVVEWEAEMSAFNRKTTDFTKFYNAYPQAQARQLHATPDHRCPSALTVQEAVRRARDDRNRDRRLRATQAPQVQGTDQGERACGGECKIRVCPDRIEPAVSCDTAS
jgi:hypothetical protein